MTTLFWLALATLLTVFGDYLIKLATLSPQGLRSAQFALGALCYGTPAIAWYALMQTHSLAMVAVLYSTATLILLTLLGVFVFRESFGLRDGLGVSLALAAVLVMHKPE
ncbi:hypothetical protein [Pseudotabrizicola alkalilacus]|uniref:Transporter n=1 Tax=Pseudotabrizicola alkalilacus TaxID=2305252 RepID=A0A411Z0U7_9RHOB|nr:hypothetical protein [Pseudotabrizicola alkalilacus]RGP36658.1 hypothetical protein D1012_13410 [Pseudotabrizicola alkalilacus]